MGARGGARPDCNVAPTKEVYAVLDRPLKDADDPRPVRQLRTLKWGLVPVLVQDARGRRPDDQRARGDRAREAVLPPPLHLPPLPAARRRLLRVGHRARRAAAGGGGQEEAAAQAALLRDARRRLGLRHGRALRVLAGQDTARRAPARLVGDVHGDHHGGGDRAAGRRPRGGPALARRHPPADAADADRRTAGTPGSTRPAPTSRSCAPCWSRRPAG